MIFIILKYQNANILKADFILIISYIIIFEKNIIDFWIIFYLITYII